MADIWSAACCAYKFAMGRKLFEPREERHWDKKQDHLKLIIEAVGHFPDCYKKAKFYDSMFLLKILRKYRNFQNTLTAIDDRA